MKCQLRLYGKLFSRTGTWNGVNKQKFWVHPYIYLNAIRSAFVAAQELVKDEEKFKSFCRMLMELFIELAKELLSYLTKKGMHCRKCISVEGRLLWWEVVFFKYILKQIYFIRPKDINLFPCLPPVSWGVRRDVG